MKLDGVTYRVVRNRLKRKYKDISFDMWTLNSKDIHVYIKHNYTLFKGTVTVCSKINNIVNIDNIDEPDLISLENTIIELINQKYPQILL